MAATESASAASPSLHLPPRTFAALTPAPYLQAHLQQPQPTRPSGRQPNEARTPHINTGSLTHANGSAVVRWGDTAVVCSVRGELLRAEDVAEPVGEPEAHADDEEEGEEEDVVETLGLLVPNVEMGTGCSAKFLPGQPPGSVAQGLSWRAKGLLGEMGVGGKGGRGLRVRYSLPEGLGGEDEEGGTVTKAFWTLYVDVLCIALDGSAFDAIWAAIVAALRDTMLPKAWWDADREMVVCSPRVADAAPLELLRSPVAASFAVFSTFSPLKSNEGVESWVLADPDGFEEGICRETVSVVVGDGGEVLRIEKSGGGVVGREEAKECVRLAGQRLVVLQKMLGRG